MTKKEFMEAYAEKSEIPLEMLEELGFVAIPCDCNYEKCQGWRVVYKKREGDKDLNKCHCIVKHANTVEEREAIQKRIKYCEGIKDNHGIKMLELQLDNSSCPARQEKENHVK